MNKNLCNFTQQKPPLFQLGDTNSYFDFAIGWKSLFYILYRL